MLAQALTNTQDLHDVVFDRWYVAAGLIIVIMLLVVRIVLLLTHGSHSAAYSAALITLLTAGLVSYSQAPAVAIASLGMCFAMALLEIVLAINPSWRGKREEANQ